MKNENRSYWSQRERTCLAVESRGPLCTHHHPSPLEPAHHVAGCAGFSPVSQVSWVGRHGRKSSAKRLGDNWVRCWHVVGFIRFAFEQEAWMGNGTSRKSIMVKKTRKKAGRYSGHSDIALVLRSAQTRHLHACTVLSAQNPPCFSDFPSHSMNVSHPFISLYWTIIIFPTTIHINGIVGRACSLITTQQNHTRTIAI